MYVYKYRQLQNEISVNVEVNPIVWHPSAPKALANQFGQIVDICPLSFNVISTRKVFICISVYQLAYVYTKYLYICNHQVYVCTYYRIYIYNIHVVVVVCYYVAATRKPVLEDFFSYIFVPSYECNPMQCNAIYKYIEFQ